MKMTGETEYIPVVTWADRKALYAQLDVENRGSGDGPCSSVSKSEYQKRSILRLSPELSSAHPLRAWKAAGVCHKTRSKINVSFVAFCREF